MTAAEIGSASRAATSLPDTHGDRVHACTVRPAPQREPRFDDELAVRRLSLVPPVVPELPFPAPLLAANRRPLTLVPSRSLTADAPGAPDQQGRPTPARRAPRDHVDAPDPTRFGRQFAQGLVEVLSGRRPAGQLTRHVSPAVQRGLGRSGAGHQLRSAVAPTVHSLHLSEPAHGVCEMSAIVAVGPRYRAVAARLEWKVDHWLCTALQVG